MLFAYDTEVALAATAALVNTAVAPDTLTDLAELDDFLERYPTSGRVDHSEAELTAMRDLRPVLRRLWSGDEREVVEVTNGLLRQYQALPQLVKHDDWDWHLHACADDVPLVARSALEAAMAIVDVLRQGELARLRLCGADDCDGVVVDLSKNRSRRYCDRGCGNRTNVAAYRARQRATG